MLTEDQTKDLEAKYPGLTRLAQEIDGEDVEFFVRRPTRAEYKMWRVAIHDDQKRPEATEILVRQCCVHPDRDAVLALLDKYPGLFDGAGVQRWVVKVTGAAAEARGK